MTAELGLTFLSGVPCGPFSAAIPAIGSPHAGTTDMAGIGFPTVRAFANWLARFLAPLGDLLLWPGQMRFRLAKPN